MKITLVLASIVALAGSVGCSSLPLNQGGTDGAAGMTGAPGTSDTAGTTDTGGTTGLAGATGGGGDMSVAGATGTAGTAGAGGTIGVAGATGMAGTLGTAGAAGTTAVGGMSGGGGGASVAGTTGTAGTIGGCGGMSVTGTAGTSGTAGLSGAGGTGDVVPDGGAVATKPDGTCKGMAFKHAAAGGAVCICQTATPKACATSCVDPQTDPDNCGFCGHACATHATCNGGQCGPSPALAVARPAANCAAMSLVASNGTLYWSDTGNRKVFKMSATAGGTPTPVSASETTSPTSVVVRGPTVFWLDGRVIRKSVCGTISVVFASAVPIHGLAASDDGATVFFSTGDGLSAQTIGKVQRVPSTGGAPVDVAFEENMGVPGALAVQGSLVVYPTDINGDVDIATVGATPSQCWASAGEEPPGVMNVGCNRIARSQGSLSQSVILASGGNLFWVDGHNVKMNDFGATAAASNQEIAAADNNVRSIAVGGSEVFFVEFDDNLPTTGTVQKAAMIEGSPLVPLARNINGPGSVAVDGNRAFWSTADCEIQTTTTGE